MKLIGDFFHIKETVAQDETLLCKVGMNAGHGIYSVHFPSHPVTPGVCLLQMATEILESHFNRKLKLDTAQNIRFKNPVSPMDEPRFDFSKIFFEGDEVKVKLLVTDETRQFLSMSLKYRISK